jgi:hypothetical protein
MSVVTLEELLELNKSSTSELQEPRPEIPPFSFQMLYDWKRENSPMDYEKYPFLKFIHGELENSDKQRDYFNEFMEKRNSQISPHYIDATTAEPAEKPETITIDQDPATS